jgi:hypothetical protein
MTLISQPGSDYQITSISLDAGYTGVPLEPWRLPHSGFV